jgi:hypothetical protein
MTVLYCVISDAFEDGEYTYTTKAKAMRECRSLGDTPASVWKQTLRDDLPLRELLAAIANRRQFVAKNVMIYRNYDPEAESE